MADDYIPWWVPADDPRRRGVVPAAEVVAPDPAPDAADVLIEPSTPVQGGE